MRALNSGAFQKVQRDVAAQVAAHLPAQLAYEQVAAYEAALKANDKAFTVYMYTMKSNWLRLLQGCRQRGAQKVGRQHVETTIPVEVGQRHVMAEVLPGHGSLGGKGAVAVPQAQGHPIAPCRQFVWRALAAGWTPAGLHFVEVGSWWSGNEEIDVVAVDEADRPTLIGSCKWSRQPVDVRNYAELQQAASRAGFDPAFVVLALFSRAGFTKRLRDLAKASDRVWLVDLETMYS